MTRERALELAQKYIAYRDSYEASPCEDVLLADAILAAVAEDRAAERQKSAQFLKDAAGLDVASLSAEDQATPAWQYQRSVAAAILAAYENGKRDGVESCAYDAAEAEERA